MAASKETAERNQAGSVDALRKFLSPGDVAIDIGAHYGRLDDSHCAGRGEIRVRSGAGAESLCFFRAAEKPELNPAKTNIIPLMFAATPEDAEMEFQYSDSGFCNGGRFEGMSKWLHGHAFRLKVQGRNLHAFIRKEFPELLPRIRYIKMDTEGYESDVLRSPGH